MKKKLIIIMMLVILATSLAACGNKEASSLPDKVRVGIIRVPNDTSVAIKEQYFEKYFDQKGVEVEYIFFDSGVSANQAFLAGAIDFAEMGFTNGLVALANDLPVKLIWIHEILGTNEALVVRDSSLNSLEELKGKKIATFFSSTAHLSLLKALEMNNMSEKDTSLLNMETAEIVAAWERGDIDAAYTWEPTLSRISQTGKVLLSSADLAEKGVLTANIRLVHTDFAKKYPDLVTDFISALSEAGDLYRSDPPKAIQSAANYLGISYEDAMRQMDGSRWLTSEEQLSSSYMGDGGDFLKSFSSAGDYWYQQGFINRQLTESEIREFIDTTYIKESLEK